MLRERVSAEVPVAVTDRVCVPGGCGLDLLCSGPVRNAS